MKKVIIGVILAFISMLLSACEIYIDPSQLICAPEVKEKSILINNDIMQAYKSFLPEGFRVLDESEIVNNKPIQNINIIDNSKEELIVFFGNETKKGFMILTNNNGVLHKEYQKIIKCKSIKKFSMVNIFGSNKKSLIIGFFIDDDLGTEYNSYRFKDNSITEEKLGIWSKLDIIKESSGSEESVAAVWDKQAIGYMTIDFLKFNNRGVYLSSDYYEDYSKKTSDYYNKLLQDNMKNKAPVGFAYYGLIRTELQAGHAMEVLNLTEVSDKMNYQYPLTKEKVNYLKAKAYNELSNFNLASELLKVGINQQVSKINLLEVDEIGKGELSRDLGYMYIELARALKGKSEKVNSKDELIKAVNIFKNLDMDGYYKKLNNGLIYKELDFNTVSSEVELLDS